MNITNFIVSDGYDAIPFLGLLRINWSKYKLFAAPAELIDEDWFQSPYWNVFELFPELRRHEIIHARKFRQMVGWDWHFWNDSDASHHEAKMPVSKSTKNDWIEEQRHVQSPYDDLWRHIQHCKVIGVTYNLRTVEEIPKPYLITLSGVRMDKGEL